MKIKINTYYLYTYKSSRILTRTYEHNSKHVWSKDTTEFYGNEGLADTWEFEDGVKNGTAKDVVEVSLETHPEYFI